jgi:hypothetical protein
LGAGTVAAPFLAGFAFTLLVLIVPTFANDETVVKGHGFTVARHATSFSGAPKLAALFLLASGLLLIFSVQAAIFVSYYGHTPDELKEWYPQSFPVAPDPAQPGQVPVPAALKHWDTPEFPATRVDTQWYSGAMRTYLRDQIKTANRWARWMRGLYHAAILSLLSGIAALVWPPAHQWSDIRTALTVLALVGVAIEGLWIVLATALSPKARKAQNTTTATNAEPGQAAAASQPSTSAATTVKPPG